MSLCPLTAPAATVVPYTTALESAVVSVFVPPTRADDPYAATEEMVYRWDADSGAWSAVYSPPWTTTRIRTIAGYAKSSKVLYVVHNGGISRTGDEGESWVEAVPPGFKGNSRNFSISVNPEERRHAVVYTGERIWETTDYGESYQANNPHADWGQVIGGGFLPSIGESPRYLLAREGGLLLMEGSPLRVTAVHRMESLLARCLVHPEASIAFVERKTGEWLALSLPAEGSRGRQDLSVRAGGEVLVPLASGSSSLWSAREARLSLVSLVDPALPTIEVAVLPGPVKSLNPHPRDQASLYAGVGNQLYRVEDAFSGASPAFIRPLSLAGLRSMDWQSPVAATAPEFAAAPGGEQEMDAAVLIARVLAGEPTLQEAIDKAFAYEQSDPLAFLEWQEKARLRNRLPEFRIEGGFRQYPVDDNLIVTSADEFGFEEREDFRLPDRIRDLAFFGIVLEWQLDELVYDNEITDIHRERRDTFKDRRELIEDMAELYYARVEKIVEADGLLGSPSQARKIRLLLEIHQLSEILNGYCGEPLFDPFPLD